MAKTKISEFSTTAGNNTDINSINIAEGCAPSGINDAIRELMRQLKEFQTGGAGDSVNSGGDFSVATNKFTVASASGNTAVAGTLGVTGAATLSSTLAVTGTTTLTGALVANGNATLGDGSGDTVTVKGTPTLEVNPTLSGGTANGVAYLNGSKVLTTGSALIFTGTNLGVGVNPTNAKLEVAASSGEVFRADASGGAFRIVANQTNVSLNGGSNVINSVNGTEVGRFTSTGLGIGTSSPSVKLDVVGTAKFSGGGGYVSYGDNGYIRTDIANKLAFQVGTSGATWRTSGNSGDLMLLDNSGNLGLGVTPSAWTSSVKALQIGNSASVSSYNLGNSLNLGSNFYDAGGGAQKYVNTAAASRFDVNPGSFSWNIAASGTAGNAITFTQAMTLDASGRLLVGTTTAPSGGIGKLAIYGGSGGGVQMIAAPNDGGALLGPLSGGGYQFYTYTGANGSESYTERARIDSSGSLLVGTTGNTRGGVGAYFASTDVFNAYIGVGAGSISSLFTGWYGATSTTTGTLSFNVTSNGNVTNTNNSYGAISDAKLKENIVDASPKLADLMQVRVRNYNFKEGQTHKQIGVVAQELEQVFPAMIDEVPDRDSQGNDLGTTTKQVKYSVFVPMLIKAIQEQQSIIEQLTARVAALES